MFKNKRIAELERENLELKREVERLEQREANWERRFDAINETMSSLPDDCKPGEWCRSCQFGRMFVRYDRHIDNYESLYLCGKDSVCKNFVQKDFKKGKDL